MHGEDWASSDDEEEPDFQYIFDDNLETKQDIFIIGEGNKDRADGNLTTKSSAMMRDVRKNLPFSKLFKQKRKEIWEFYYK